MKLAGLLSRHSRLQRAASLAVLDQALYSASNVLVLVLAARSGLAEGGSAALFQAGYAVTTTLAQGSVIESTIVQGRERLEDAGPKVALLAALLGSLWAAVALCAYAASGEWVLAVVTALAAPAITVHYALRAWLISLRRLGRVAASDGAWLACQLACFWALREAGLPALTASITAWCVGGVISLLVLGVPRRWSAGPRPLKQLQQNLLFSWEQLIGQGAAQAGLFLTAALAGTATVGLYRTSQVVFTPVNLLSQPVRQVVLPTVVGSPPRQQVRIAVGASVLLCLASLGCLVVFLLGPQVLGRTLTGESWPAVRAVLPFVVVESLAGATTFAPILLMRARNRIHRSIVIQACASAITLLTAAGAALLSDTPAHFAMVVPFGAVAAALLWHSAAGVAGRRRPQHSTTDDASRAD